jgi:phosphohistidine phosphatase
MRLILLRHAKSSWDDPSLDDHDRPLNARGRHAAPKVGAWIAARPPLPDRILVSTARRARETWEVLGLPGAAAFRADLYLAGPEAIRAALPAEGSALVIGHNDGLRQAAAAFCAVAPRHPDFERFPTAACVMLSFEAAAEWGRGRVEDFVVPRDL